MLYSVVEGRVLVGGDNGVRREVGPRQAFGVPEVLSGRQRRTRAEVQTATLALAIGGEDFFDLLSNNINIVKALFREVLDEPNAVGSRDQKLPRGAALPAESAAHS